MNILVQLSHPAHFHYYHYAILNWKQNGHNVIVAIKSKDVLEMLLKNANIPYINIEKKAHRGNKWGLLWDMLVRDWCLLKICLREHIHLLTGSSAEVAQIGWLLHLPVVCIGEDDSTVIPAYVKMTLPFLGKDRMGLVPTVCERGRMEKNTVHYPSYCELGYLHPHHFTPSSDVVSSYGIDINHSYFIFRFASLKAHHDSGISGINTEIAQHLIDILAPHGTIYITSERLLEPQFEKYRIHINPLDMHHVMAFASLYIGDSQTMAAEAGVLGTPFVRFNDFVGRIGYLRELEDVYQLGYGIRASNTPILYKEDGSEQPHGKEALYETVEKLLALSADERKKLFAARREKMLEDKIDYSKFLVWFVENYPSSAKEAKGNADKMFWNQFK